MGGFSLILMISSLVFWENKTQYALRNILSLSLTVWRRERDTKTQRPFKLCYLYLFIIAPIQLVLAASLCGILAAEITKKNVSHTSLMTVHWTRAHVTRSWEGAQRVTGCELPWPLECNLKKASSHSVCVSRLTPVLSICCSHTEWITTLLSVALCKQRWIHMVHRQTDYWESSIILMYMLQSFLISMLLYFKKYITAINNINIGIFSIPFKIPWFSVDKRHFQYSTCLQVIWELSLMTKCWFVKDISTEHVQLSTEKKMMAMACSLHTFIISSDVFYSYIISSVKPATFYSFKDMTSGKEMIT